MDHFLAWIALYGPSIMGWAGTISLIASGIVAITPTPPPESKFRPIYRAIEYLGLVVGYAKDRGFISPTARQAALTDKAVEIGAEIMHRVTVTDVPDLPATIVQAAPGDMSAAVAGFTDAVKAFSEIVGTHKATVVATANAAAEGAAAGATEALAGAAAAPLVQPAAAAPAPALVSAAA